MPLYMLTYLSYGFGLCLKPSDLNKKFLEGQATLWPMIDCPRSFHVLIWPNMNHNTNNFRKHEYF